MACGICEEYMDRVRNLRPPTVKEFLHKRYIQNCDACHTFCVGEYRKHGKYPRKNCHLMAHYAQLGRATLERQKKKLIKSGLNAVPFMSGLGASIVMGHVLPEAPNRPPLLLPKAPTTPIKLKPDAFSKPIAGPTPPPPSAGGRGASKTRPTASRGGRGGGTRTGPRRKMLLELIRLNKDNGMPSPREDLSEIELCQHVKYWIRRLEHLGIELNYNVSWLRRKKSDYGKD